jgi:predicted nucleotidyltransferase
MNSENMKFRDKDYLLTSEGLIFNVLGYDHVDKKITAGLKYIDGKKWEQSYQESIHWLKQHDPQYVDRWIEVPISKITKYLCPQQRVTQLIQTPTSFTDQYGLLDKSVRLIQKLSDFFGIPIIDFGITDSLLWGQGNEDSDIDVVVYGKPNALILLDKLSNLFDEPDFEFIDPRYIQRPPNLAQAEFDDLASRKTNQGFYQGTRFSLRAVRNRNEISPAEPLQTIGQKELQLTIADHQESIFYPVIYPTQENVEIVSFEIGYECVFRKGDQVTVSGQLEESHNRRRILVGSNQGKSQRIQLRVDDPLA